MFLDALSSASAENCHVWTVATRNTEGHALALAFLIATNPSPARLALFLHTALLRHGVRPVAVVTPPRGDIVAAVDDVFAGHTRHLMCFAEVERKWCVH